MTCGGVVTPVPAMEAGRGRRGAARGRRLTSVPITELVIAVPAEPASVDADDSELPGLDGLPGVTSPDRRPEAERLNMINSHIFRW